jgi:hypothetical protein
LNKEKLTIPIKGEITSAGTSAITPLYEDIGAGIIAGEV